MKLNEDICDLLISRHKAELFWANIESSRFWESEKSKNFWIVTDRNLYLYFDKYILWQCKNAGRKLSVIIKTWKFIKIVHRIILIKAFIEPQFGYFSFVWMCFNWSCDNRTNHLHKWALRIVYNDNISSFEDLLKRNQSVIIRHRNILLLGTELH